MGHRVEGELIQAPWAYVLRVAVRNASPRPCRLQSVARYYVMRALNGKVSYIHRVTEGPAGYILSSGEEYKYAAVFVTRYKTLAWAGGMLFSGVRKRNSG